MPTVKTTLSATACALMLAATAVPAAAQSARPPSKLGVLECNVGAGVGLIITSSKPLNCTFTSSRRGGPREAYVGTVRKFGLDVGATAKGRLVWAVFAPTNSWRPGALAGGYGGATAEATVGAGLGANVLVGGSDRTISLQPISVQAQTGINLAVGVADLQLDPAPRR
jgi:hypothetical protein